MIERIVVNNIIHQRCFTHQAREAVARCPECRRFFCRECVSEYEDRLLCSSCLRKMLAKQTKKSKSFKMIFAGFEFLSGSVLTWLFFYYFGRILLTLPDAFHNGTLWQSPWWMQ